MPMNALERRRHHVVLDLAGQEVPLDLGADEPGLGSSPRRPWPPSAIWAADTFELAMCRTLPCSHELVERFEGLVDRGLGIGVVLVVQIDAVGAEPAQAGLAAIDDPLPQHARRVGLILRAGQELGGDHDLVPPAAEGGAEKLLRLAAAVHLGGVEVGDAGVEGGVDDGRRGVACRCFMPKLLQPRPTTESDGPSPPSWRVSTIPPRPSCRKGSLPGCPRRDPPVAADRPCGRSSRRCCRP